MILAVFSAFLAAGLSVAPLPSVQSKVKSACDRVVDQAFAASQRKLESGLSGGKGFWEDHSTFSNPYIARTDHYEVRTCQSFGLALRTANEMEEMLVRFQDVLGTDYLPPARFVVLIFPTLEEYNAFGNTHGDQHSSLHGSFFAPEAPDRPAVTYYTININLTRLRKWVTHSAFHQFAHAAFGRSVPSWIEEGLACYFDMQWARPYAVSKLPELLRSPRSLRLRNLSQFSVDNLNDEVMIEIGMLLRYLIEEREDTRSPNGGEDDSEGPFTAYLRAVYRGANFSQNSAHLALSRTPDAIEADFKSYDFKSP